MAMAAKNSGGLVIVQVERLAEAGSLPARQREDSRALVDCVAVAGRVPRADLRHGLRPAFAGELRVPLESLAPSPSTGGRSSAGARRSSCPGTASSTSASACPSRWPAWRPRRACCRYVTLTAEPGVIGGVPASGLNFGAAVNTEALVDQNQQFDFYDGGGLDQAVPGHGAGGRRRATSTSAGSGRSSPGAGGFINISQNARKVVFVGTFTCNGLALEIGDGRLRILKEGQGRKFVPAVEQVTFSGKRARELGHETMYVTERAVFRLTDERAAQLEEIAPGIDLEHEVLGQMEFAPEIRRPLGMMDPRIFRRRADGPAAAAGGAADRLALRARSRAGGAVHQLRRAGDQGRAGPPRHLGGSGEGLRPAGTADPGSRRLRRVQRARAPGGCVRRAGPGAHGALLRAGDPLYLERVPPTEARRRPAGAPRGHPELFDTQRHALESLKRRRRTRTSPAGSDR